MTPLSIWEKNFLEVETEKFFTNSRIFDELSAEGIPNKFRRFETLVGEIFNGQNENLNEFIRKIPVRGHKSTPIFFAAKVARLRVLRGCKDFPWNSCREQFVELFFNKDGIPYVNPYMTNGVAKDVNPERVNSTKSISPANEVNPTENIIPEKDVNPARVNTTKQISLPKHSSNERITFGTPPNIHFNESKLEATETKKKQNWTRWSFQHNSNVRWWFHRVHEARQKICNQTKKSKTHKKEEPNMVRKILESVENCVGNERVHWRLQTSFIPCDENEEHWRRNQRYPQETIHRWIWIQFSHMHSISQEVNSWNSFLLHSDVWTRKDIIWFSLQPHKMRRRSLVFFVRVQWKQGLTGQYMGWQVWNWWRGNNSNCVPDTKRQMKVSILKCCILFCCIQG